MYCSWARNAALDSRFKQSSPGLGLTGLGCLGWNALLSPRAGVFGSCGGMAGRNYTPDHAWGDSCVLPRFPAVFPRLALVGPTQRREAKPGGSQQGASRGAASPSSTRSLNTFKIAEITRLQASRRL